MLVNFIEAKRFLCLCEAKRFFRFCFVVYLDKTFSKGL